MRWSSPPASRGTCVTHTGKVLDIRTCSSALTLPLCNAGTVKDWSFVHDRAPADQFTAGLPLVSLLHACLLTRFRSLPKTIVYREEHAAVRRGGWVRLLDLRSLFS